MFLPLMIEHWRAVFASNVVQLYMFQMRMKKIKTNQTMHYMRVWDKKINNVTVTLQQQFRKLKRIDEQFFKNILQKLLISILLWAKWPCQLFFKILRDWTILEGSIWNHVLLLIVSQGCMLRQVYQYVSERYNMTIWIK